MAADVGLSYMVAPVPVDRTSYIFVVASGLGPIVPQSLPPGQLELCGNESPVISRGVYKERSPLYFHINCLRRGGIFFYNYLCVGHCWLRKIQFYVGFFFFFFGSRILELLLLVGNLLQGLGQLYKMDGTKFNYLFMLFVFCISHLVSRQIITL